MQQPRIAFEPVGRNHFGLLRTWLEEPHWREWWGNPETEMTYIVDMVEGRDTTKPFIFHINGAPTGYIQQWFIGDHQCEPWITDHPWLQKLPSDAVGVDLSIGPPGMVSKGIGSTVLRAFAAGLVEAGWSTIIIDPDPDNLRAVRAYRKAGFTPIPELVGKTAGCLIMRYEET